MAEEDHSEEKHISARMTENTPVYYINFVEVSHTQYEFALTATRYPATPGELQQDERIPGFVEPKAVCQLLLPVAVMPGLIKAMQEQLHNYERERGHAIAFTSPEMH